MRIAGYRLLEPFVFLWRHTGEFFDKGYDVPDLLVIMSCAERWHGRHFDAVLDDPEQLAWRPCFNCFSNIWCRWIQTFADFALFDTRPDMAGGAHVIIVGEAVSNHLIRERRRFADIISSRHDRMRHGRAKHPFFKGTVRSGRSYVILSAVDV